MLSELGALRTQLMNPTSRSATGAPTSASDSFAAQLDASFRARAEQLGLTLPAAHASTGIPGTSDATSSSGEGVDAIWKRVQLQSAALHGPGDAIMQAVGEAADARWQKQRHRGESDLFDM